MIIDGALTLRELKQAVDEAIQKHGDQIPVELVPAQKGWAGDTAIETPWHSSVTRFQIRA